MSKHLPVRCPPLPDELFSSWMHRLAWANGEKAQALAFKSWGREPNVWMADVDRNVKNEQLAALSDISGETVTRLQDTTLAAYRDWLVAAFPPRGPIKWILPLSVTKNRHFGRGVQYCAQCLATDERPYFRRQWRVAFACYCTVHEVALSEGCPACSGPVGLHLCDRRHRHARYEYPLIQCHLCGTRLTAVEPRTTVDKQLMMLQRFLANGITLGWMWIGDRVVYSPLVLEGIRMLCVFLTRHRQSGRLHAQFAALGIDLSHPLFYSRRAAFEDLFLAPRTEVLRAVAWLVAEWPDRLIEVCRKADISSSYLLEVSRSPPFWFWEPVHLRLDRGWYAPADEEIDAAWRYLHSVHPCPQKRALAQLLGISYLNHKTYKRLN